MDIAAISGIMSSVKATKDIAESMIGLAQGEAMRGKVFELQSKMLDAQQFAFAAQEERAALIEAVRDLKEQVAKFEAWAAEKQRYELAELAVGAFAYVVKESMRGLEPPHCICAACYQQAKKSILQGGETRTARGMPVKTLRCTACKAEIITKHLQPRPPVIG